MMEHFLADLLHKLRNMLAFKYYNNFSNWKISSNIDNANIQRVHSDSKLIPAISLPKKTTSNYSSTFTRVRNPIFKTTHASLNQPQLNQTIGWKLHQFVTSPAKRRIPATKLPSYFMRLRKLHHNEAWSHSLRIHSQTILSD